MNWPTQSGHRGKTWRCWRPLSPLTFATSGSLICTDSVAVASQALPFTEHPTRRLHPHRASSLADAGPCIYSRVGEKWSAMAAREKPNPEYVKSGPPRWIYAVGAIVAAGGSPGESSATSSPNPSHRSHPPHRLRLRQSTYPAVAVSVSARCQGATSPLALPPQRLRRPQRHRRRPAAHRDSHQTAWGLGAPQRFIVHVCFAGCRCQTGRCHGFGVRQRRHRLDDWRGDQDRLDAR